MSLDSLMFLPVNRWLDDNPQMRARWVAQEFRGRCGDKHEYFSETPDLALVKSVIAHAARWAEHEDVVVAVFDVRRTSTQKRRETPLLNSQTTCPLDSVQHTLENYARRCTEPAQRQHHGEMS